MKTFKDLVFKKHSSGLGVHAREKFDNGFELSVVAGEHLYSTPRESSNDVDFFSSFEIAIFDMTGGFITRQIIGGNDDVAGWKSRDEISSIMERLTNIR